MNFATSNCKSKTKQRERPKRCLLYYALDVAIRICEWRVKLCYIHTSAWGFQRCTLKDDIFYLLPTWLSVGTRKYRRKHHFVGWQERTNKMKNKSCATNFATQQPFLLLLLLQEPFLLAERKKDVLLIYGCQPKPIHKYKFIHLRIYILMDWMNWTNCGAIAQSCHVQYWVVALFLSASKNSCMISVTFHL